MKALYIGILSQGTTSQLRCGALQSVSGWEWSKLDTDKPFLASPRWARSLAFRLRVGPVVSGVNRAVIDKVANNRYDLIWVDKGVYLWPETVDRLRDCAATLVHYTPDTAFLNNRSRFFTATACRYDLLVTTKSFEKSYYEGLVPEDHVYMTTQSFDSNLHRSRCEFSQKRSEAVFIGLCEPDREACMERLLSAKIPVRIGGQGWDSFVKRHESNPLLTFEGARVFGDHYSEVLSKATVGLGLVSKRFPELHTTRTFEIPACGTVLATERNEETESLFDGGQAIFFDDYEQLADELSGIWDQPDTIRRISLAGQERVRSGGFDNETVMRRVLKRLSLL